MEEGSILFSFAEKMYENNLHYVIESATRETIMALKNKAKNPDLSACHFTNDFEQPKSWNKILTTSSTTILPFSKQNPECFDNMH